MDTNEYREGRSGHYAGTTTTAFHEEPPGDGSSPKNGIQIRKCMTKNIVFKLLYPVSDKMLYGRNDGGDTVLEGIGSHLF